MRYMRTVRAVCCTQLLAGLLMLRLVASADAPAMPPLPPSGSLLLVAELGSPTPNECDRHFASRDCTASLAFAVTDNGKIQLVATSPVVDCNSALLVFDAIGAPRARARRAPLWLELIMICVLTSCWPRRAGTSAGVTVDGVKYTLMPTATGRNVLLKVQDKNGVVCNSNYLVYACCSHRYVSSRWQS